MGDFVGSRLEFTPPVIPVLYWLFKAGTVPWWAPLAGIAGFGLSVWSTTRRELSDRLLITLCLSELSITAAVWLLLLFIVLLFSFTFGRFGEMCCLELVLLFSKLLLMWIWSLLILFSLAAFFTWGNDPVPVLLIWLTDTVGGPFLSSSICFVFWKRKNAKNNLFKLCSHWAGHVPGSWMLGKIFALFCKNDRDFSWLFKIVKNEQKNRIVLMLLIEFLKKNGILTRNLSSIRFRRSCE